MGKMPMPRRGWRDVFRGVNTSLIDGMGGVSLLLFEVVVDDS